MEINKTLNSLKTILNIKNVDNEKLIPIILDITKIYDKEINHFINETKKIFNFKINSYEKKLIRNYLLNLVDKNPYPDYFKTPIKISNEKILDALNIIQKGLNKNPEKVKGTILARINLLTETKKDFNYLEFIQEKEKNKYQMIIIETDKIDINLIKNIIISEYDNLSNYHYLAIIVENKNEWENLAEIAIFCENFRIEKNFNIFNKNKEKRIQDLITFIKENPNIKYDKNIEEGIKTFYEGVSYGFQFTDLLISEDASKKILLLQKIELDETPIPCPDCYQKIVRSNSYPKLLLKSFECQNPICPSRSKSGRGKRFDYISIKKNIYLNNKENQIDEELHKIFRKDIFKHKEKINEMLLKFFTWKNENILYISNKLSNQSYNLFDRKILYKSLHTYKKNTKHKPLKLDILFEKIIKNISLKQETDYKIESVSQNILTILGNSTNIIPNLNYKIKYVITSPPYYNAREYSQWNNFISYLIDMAINAYSIYNKLDNTGLYFYNIGDIVSQDNIFITSNMSKRRLMLGFYSIYIFKKIGFSTINNIIWNKGEVQSKRNSSPNLFPHYIKPINCYEHIIIFAKDKNYKLKINKPVLNISPVKKINSKGVNILGHTAPYPIELINHILKYCNTQRDEYILDPFLGSGTTLIACCINNKKAIGIELNDKYYKLSKSRIKDLCSKKLI